MSGSKTVNYNLLINGLNQLLGVGFPILIQYFLIRHFNIEDLGYLSILNSYYSLFLLVLSFFNFYLLKIFARKRSENSLKCYLTNSLVLIYGLLLMPMIILILYLCIRFNNILDYVLITSFSILTAPLSFEIYFQAQMKNQYIFIRRLCMKLILVLTIMLAAKEENDFIIYLYVLTLTSTGENILNFLLLRKYIDLATVHFRILKIIFNNSINYLIFNISYNILPNLSIIAASYYLSIKVVSIYAILIRIINLATTFITSAVMVLYPYKISTGISLGSKRFNDEKYLYNTILISVFVIIGLILCRDIVFYMFLNGLRIPNMDFEFSLLTLFILFHSIYNYIVFNVFFHKGEVRTATILNILLILIYGLTFSFNYINILRLSFSVMYIIPFPIIMIIIFYIVRNRINFIDICKLFIRPLNKRVYKCVD